jgi:hypothetical protein
VTLFINFNIYVKNVFTFTLPLLYPNGHHHERSINIFSGFSVLFDAIPTGWVSKHYSVGLIRLQRRRSDTVDAQLRFIPKCAVKMSAVSLQRHGSDAVAVQRRFTSIPKGYDYSEVAPTLLRVKKCLFRHN